WPPAAVSSSRGPYRLCTRRDTPLHPGHAAAGLQVLAWIRTSLPTAKTCSTSTPSRCGRRTSATSRPYGQNRHTSRITTPQGTPRCPNQNCARASIRTPPTVPCGSRRPGSLRLHAGHHLASKRISARLIPESPKHPGSDVVLEFRHVSNDSLALAFPVPA